ncbi:hypothetical protein HOLleu_35374 [Holothuria leucospilota]|uniref:Uncharacterized protein n=1 Tax=Holothuria leucospilota TaxID=206669 RepID=A0A9Q0YPC2_HOLLE|nr:hypothetical protein HOLleu_35374 [Holothuria leucospilota]
MTENEHFFCAQGKQTGYIQDRLKNMRRYLPGVAKKRSSHTTLTQNTQKVLKLHADNTPPQPIPEEEQKQLASFCKRATPDLKSDIKDAMGKLYGNLKAMYSFLFVVLSLPANSKSKGAKNQALDLLIDFQPVGESVEIYLMTEHRQKQPHLLCFGSRKAPSQFFIIVDKQAI